MICRRSIVCHVSLNRVYVYILYRMRWDTFESFNVFCFFSRCLCVALIWLSFLFVCFIIVFFILFCFVCNFSGPSAFRRNRPEAREEYVFYFLFSAGGKKTKQENRKRDTITRCCCPPHLIFPTFLLFVQFLFFFLSLHCSPNMAQNIIIIILTFCFCFVFFQLSSFPYQSFYSFLPISSFSRLFCPCTEESLILFRACVLSRLISFVLFFLIIKRNRKRRKEKKEDGTISHFVFCFGLLS